MGNPFASTSSSGSSPFSGSGSIVVNSAPKKSSGGSVLGKIAATVADVATLGLSGHVTGDTGYAPDVLGDVIHGGRVAAAKTASTALSLGTGLYGLGKDAVAPGNYSLRPLISAKAWEQVIDPHAYKQDPLGRDLIGMGKSTAVSLAHPERDPVQTAITVLMLASGGFGTAAKLGYAADALKAAKVGETGRLVLEDSAAAKAAAQAGETVTPLTRAEKVRLIAKVAKPTSKVPTSQRFLHQPIVSLEHPAVDGERAAGPANMALSHEPVQLHASGGHLFRAVQGLHDVVAQRALDGGLMTAKQSRTAKYAERRIAGATSEAARVTSNVRGAQVGRVATAMNDLDKGVPRRIGQLATFLRSANVTGEEAARYWGDQAEKGIGARTKVGMEGARVKLAGKVGQRQTQVLAKLAQKIHDQGMLRLGDDGNVRVDETRFPKLSAADSTIAEGQATREKILGDYNLMKPEHLQSRLDLVASRMLGGEARQGQGFVSLRTSRKGAPQSGVARASGAVIPLAKRLSVGKTATGKGVAAGLIPASTSLTVARGLSEALRFVNSDELRGRVARLGSDVKRHATDILVRDPRVAKEAKIPQEIQEMLGRSESTLTEPEHSTLREAATKAFEDHIPALTDKARAANDRAANLGTAAPEGFKWVPKHVVPDSLTTAVEARGKAEKFADTVNSAVTSATVYFKLGHLPTRFLTNLSTNLVQGSLSPGELKRSVTLAHRLTDAQKMDLTAATGTHGYGALPHAGTGAIAKVATKGSSAWARHIDAPFRLNAVLYELRQVGIDTPAKIDEAIGHLKDPARDGMSAAEASKLDWAIRRANRASIMYDGMSAAEKRYIARYVWFYPWTKGAVRFAGHTIAEHPAKAVAIDQTGVQGGKDRQAGLGNVPPYELGLTPLSGGPSPLTSNFSSFTPYSTSGDVAQLLSHPLNPDEGVMGQLNPIYAALATLGVESAAGKKNAVQDAFSKAVEPTPELQAINAYRRPAGPTRMFGPTNLGLGGNLAQQSLLSALARALAGTAVPRPTRKSVLEKTAHGYHTVYVPNS